MAIAAGESQPMLPSLTLIATEDYPLSRRLFLYNAPDANNPWTLALVQFAHSPRGQVIVEQSGFIAQTVQAVKIPAHAKMPASYQALAQNAQRLSVNFRFRRAAPTSTTKPCVISTG